jgi:hypothetical protein
MGTSRKNTRNASPVSGAARRSRQGRRPAKGKTVVYITDDETAFFNVDVAVFAKFPLEPLAAALGNDVSVHYVGQVGRGLFQLHFSLYNPRNADSAIHGLTKVIRALPRSTRRIWDNASKRVFDLGFQGGLKPFSRDFDITPEAIAAMSAVGGRIRVTIYAAPVVEALGANPATPKNAKRPSPRIRSPRRITRR